MINYLKAFTAVLILASAGCTTATKTPLELSTLVSPLAKDSAPNQQRAFSEQQRAPKTEGVSKASFNAEADDQIERRIIRGQNQDYQYQNGKVFTTGDGDQQQTGPLPANDATKPRTSGAPSVTTPRVAQASGAPYQSQFQTGPDPYSQTALPQGQSFQQPPNIPGGQQQYAAPGSGMGPPPGQSQVNPYAGTGGSSTVYGPSRSRNLGPPSYRQPYSSGPYADVPGGPLQLPPNFADVNAVVSEGQSGQIMLGAAVNSDAGLTGQLTISEKNFDITNYPRSMRDLFIDGNAFRGNGQGFRLEAMPGSQVQRYLVSFTEPYLMNTQVSLSTSGYYFTRNYFDYNEQRLGGRVAFGYRLTPDLSMSVGTRMENVKVFDPRVNTSNELNRSLGSNSLFMGQFTLAHDTRDHAFLATEGHYFELGFQQGFGDFDFPRGDLDYRRYFLIRERPDGSGRHTVSASTKIGVTGPDTPIFENYFAGGFSTMRGFDFRGASPIEGGVQAGGKFSFLNSVEYMFPLTADDMIRGVLFCDYGTVEQDVRFDPDTFRVAPGFGFRINLPFAGNGGAPLAFDFAFPVAKADTDDTRMFSFHMGVGR